jgi:hypothetical protein
VLSIHIGFIHIQNERVNKNQANIKFIKIQANIIIIFFQKVADIKLSFAKKSSLSSMSSHFNLTNHHNGIRFIVYSVHDLSLYIFQILGGIHSQNSKTFTPLFFAAVKCHSSCIIINTIKSNIHINIHIMSLSNFIKFKKQLSIIIFIFKSNLNEIFN